MIASKVVLASKYGKIIINRYENGKAFIICDFIFKDDNRYFYRFDDEYTDNNGNRYSIKAWVKIDGKHKYKNKIKLVNRTYGSLMSKKIITDLSNSGFYKFRGERYGVEFYASIPKCAIVPKKRISTIKRLGQIMPRDKHGITDVTSVYHGGGFSPR